MKKKSYRKRKKLINNHHFNDIMPFSWNFKKYEPTPVPFLSSRISHHSFKLISEINMDFAIFIVLFTLSINQRQLTPPPFSLFPGLNCSRGLLLWALSRFDFRIIIVPLLKMLLIYWLVKQHESFKLLYY